MKLKKITSLTLLLSFIIIVLTSFILYIVPQGRIAYWADWHMWGLSKTQWGDIHINTGILFLAALGLHIYYNWGLIKSYLKDRSKTLKIFTKEFNIAGIVVLLVVCGTYVGLPPFSSILNLSATIKDNAAEKYGEPPYGHAELSSLKNFANKMNLNLEKSIQKLNDAGYTVKNEKQTIIEISKQYNTSPQVIYLAMKSAAEKSPVLSENGDKLPDSPPEGTGNLTLFELCSQFNLDTKMIVQGLSKMQIHVQEDMTIKQISKAHQTSPIDIYENLKEIVNISGK